VETKRVDSFTLTLLIGVSAHVNEVLARQRSRRKRGPEEDRRDTVLFAFHRSYFTSPHGSSVDSTGSTARASSTGSPSVPPERPGTRRASARSASSVSARTRENSPRADPLRIRIHAATRWTWRACLQRPACRL